MLNSETIVVVLNYILLNKLFNCSFWLISVEHCVYQLDNYKYDKNNTKYYTEQEMFKGVVFETTKESVNHMLVLIYCIVRIVK